MIFGNAGAISDRRDYGCSCFWFSP